MVSPKSRRARENPRQSGRNRECSERIPASAPTSRSQISNFPTACEISRLLLEGPLLRACDSTHADAITSRVVSVAPLNPAVQLGHMGFPSILAPAGHASFHASSHLSPTTLIPSLMKAGQEAWLRRLHGPRAGLRSPRGAAGRSAARRELKRDFESRGTPWNRPRMQSALGTSCTKAQKRARLRHQCEPALCPRNPRPCPGRRLRDLRSCPRPRYAGGEAPRLDERGDDGDQEFVRYLVNLWRRGGERRCRDVGQTGRDLPDALSKLSLWTQIATPRSPPRRQRLTR